MRITTELVETKALIANTRISRLKKKVTKLTVRLSLLTKHHEHTLRLVQAINDRYSSILHNQNHYLKFRKPLVEKRQKQLLLNAANLAKRLSNIPDLKSITTKKTGHTGRRAVRHILLVSGNEARKLRALARMDFRSLLNASANRNSPNRQKVSGSKPGYRAD